MKSATEHYPKPKTYAAALEPVAPLPDDGKVRAKQIAPFLGIALSTFWLYVRQKRIAQPMRYGARVSVWDAKYIRSLADNGIPPAGTEAAK